MSDLENRLRKNFSIVSLMTGGNLSSGDSQKPCSVADVRDALVGFLRNACQEGCYSEKSGHIDPLFTLGLTQTMTFEVVREGEGLAIFAFDGRQGGHDLSIEFFFSEEGRRIEALLSDTKKWLGPVLDMNPITECNKEQVVATVIQNVIDGNPFVFGETLARVRDCVKKMPVSASRPAVGMP